MYRDQKHLYKVGYNEGFVHCTSNVYSVSFYQDKKELEKVYFFKNTYTWNAVVDSNFLGFLQQFNRDLIPLTKKKFSIHWNLELNKNENLSNDRVEFFIKNNWDNLERKTITNIKFIIMKWLTKYEVFK